MGNAPDSLGGVFFCGKSFLCRLMIAADNSGKPAREARLISSFRKPVRK